MKQQLCFLNEYVYPNKRPFKNYVDNSKWVGGLKFAIFINVHYIKNVHGGRWVVKKSKVMSQFTLIYLTQFALILSERESNTF